MDRLKISLIFILTVFTTVTFSQVKIRLFSDHSPELAVFSVTEGIYELNIFNGEPIILSISEPVIITRFKSKLSVRTRNSEGVVCDSVKLTGKSGNDSFSLRISGKLPALQTYSGDFHCFPDMGTMVMINICDIEKYIAGVVSAEGGNGRNLEYFKTQAIITRTYLYKFFDRHMTDKYNVCDNTHCQVFNGISDNKLIDRAALETKGLVILSKDSTLILAAFHSNCGGETNISESVWLTGHSYLKKVIDPYCLNSSCATWEKRMSLADWLGFIVRSGYYGKIDDPAVFNFLQESRLTDYRAGSFTLPLVLMRNDMHLRSTFFSVAVSGDSVILKGRGFGHGVGLCQEGAMVMAARGFDYKKIISFYYSGVIISDIKNAVITNNQ